LQKQLLPKVLAFDVFGTVVDWHGSVSKAVDELDCGVDANKFALAWRAGYGPAMERVMSGELGWMIIDDLHRMILDEVLEQFGIEHLSETQMQELNLIWHKLDPWPDSVEGLTKLKENFMICTLSNGNIGLLADMAKHARLPWDCILSAEVFRKYKPDPGTYLGVAEVFNVKPEEVMLVAAHQSDLAAARACGLQTAYIERPFEYGVGQVKDVSPVSNNTMHARDFLQLADLMSKTKRK
jgi:2-haloacid dehalogenase